MGVKTGIEWTDATWNPLRGCSPVSAGCKNCYAARDAKRFSGPGAPFEGLVRINAAGERTDEWNGEVHFVEKHLLDPLKWKRYGNIECVGKGKLARLEVESRPRRIFVNSVSDLFHESVPDEWIDRIFAVMALCPQHTFQVLTKRPARMLAYLTSDLVSHRIAMAICGFVKSGPVSIVRKINTYADWVEERHPDLDGFIRDWPLPNVWLGVSVENQAAADERILLLLQTPAAVRFISAEPLLGPVDLSKFLGFQHEDEIGIENIDQSLPEAQAMGMHDPWVHGLDWVICGGESGPGARPMHPDWARELRDQCARASVPFFFKQWGEWLPVMCDGALDDTAWIDWGEWLPVMCDGALDDTAWIDKEAGVVHGRGQVINASDEPQRVGKKAAGSLLDGVEHKAFPEVKNECR
jgi:protein gp37